MGFSATARIYFGPQHLASAAFFSREAKIHQETEQERELLSCVTSSIMFAAFSLEAMVNELVLDASEGAKGGAAAKLTTNFISILQQEGHIVKWSSTIKKLKHVFSVLGLPQDIENQPPYEQIETLFIFRNRLVHYEPTNEIIASTILDVPVTQHELEILLTNKFNLNPKYDPAIVPSGTFSTWHQKLLSHGAAEWAVKNARTFYEDYYKQLGLSDPFDELNINLNTS